MILLSGLIFRPKIILLICAVGLGLFVTGYRDNNDKDALLSHGKTTEAHATKIHWMKELVTNAGSDYYLDVHYRIEDGVQYDAKLKIPPEMGRLLREKGESDPIKIRYLPESPGTIRLAEGRDGQEPFPLMIVGAILTVIGIFLAISAYQQHRRERGY